MNLHSNKVLLQDAILATAEYLDMRDIYVEKDYWETVASHVARDIFTSRLNQNPISSRLFQDLFDVAMSKNFLKIGNLLSKENR